MRTHSVTGWIPSMVMVLAVMTVVGGAVLPAEDAKPAPAPAPTPSGEKTLTNRQLLRATIDEAVKRIKAKDVDWIFDKFLNPKDLQKLRDDGELDKVKKEILENGKLDVLGIYLAAVTDEMLAQVKPDDTTCRVEPKASVDGPGHLNFEKVDGIWRLNNH